MTRPKERPRRDGNRRFERVRKQTTIKPQQQNKAELAEKEPKPYQRTPQQALGETDTKGENASRGTMKKNEAGGENQTKEN